MNYTSFYTKTKNRLTDSILSLWATGDRKMQDFFKKLLDQEPLMAEPIFQGTFPWEPSSKKFGEVGDLLAPALINAFAQIQDEEFQFPLDRHPYKHQVTSWQHLLKNKKSIAVTTGTGSGKTECFMIPVLNDIYENSRNQEGINAIFLYPLNALIASQKKRMHAWCSALSGIKYAVLTGDTKNKELSKEVKEEAFPQLMDRESIRMNPPQVLFTNPTMLEYLLVRNADQPIVQKSKGKLKWILLDEAHTLTGSSAAEMALLIRRVIVAFECKESELRFAITSATVGDDNTDQLKKFMANLCNIQVSQIEVIKGHRVNTTVNNEDLVSSIDYIEPSRILRLREQLLLNKFLRLTEVGQTLGKKDHTEQLFLIDKIADAKISGENVLPLRGHFFSRGISGVYVCTNPDENAHNGALHENGIGHMTTISNKECSCGYPLLELISCRYCGHMMLEAQKIRINTRLFVSQKVSAGFDAFQMDNESENEEEQDSNNTSVASPLIRLVRNIKSNQMDNFGTCGISKEGEILDEESAFLETADCKCPFCGEQNANPLHFRLSSLFTNRVLN